MNAQISVIIPTMFKSERLWEMLTRYEHCDLVKEVILIANADVELSVLLKQKPKLCGKLKVIKTFYDALLINNYVNPSWNLGLAIAEGEYSALVNDDLTFDPDDVFGRLVERMPYCNFVGLAEQTFYPLSMNNGEVRPHGWGCLIFGKTPHFPRIPTDLKVACGDDYLWQISPYIAHGLKIETDMSTTSREFGEQAAKDLEVFNAKYKKH